MFNLLFLWYGNLRIRAFLAEPFLTILHASHHNKNNIVSGKVERWDCSADYRLALRCCFGSAKLLVGVLHKAFVLFFQATVYAFVSFF